MYQELEIVVNFGGLHCPHSGQFWGSLEAKGGQNAHFYAPGKTLSLTAKGKLEIQLKLEIQKMGENNKDHKTAICIYLSDLLSCFIACCDTKWTDKEDIKTALCICILHIQYI